MMKKTASIARALLGRSVLAIAIAAVAVGAPPRVHAAAVEHVVAGAVKVTVSYTGKGTVDSSHHLWVWLFDTPDIGPASMPVAQMSMAKNGDVATFEVVADRVWIVVAYDEKGVMTGSEPPPSGTPIGIYASGTGAPEAVTPGVAGAVTVTFDDSQRMP